jgi:hypothetical protein
VQRSRYWRTSVVILWATVAVLGVPSLPQHRYHLAYWCAAFLLEVILIAVPWPLDRTGH